MAKRRRVFIISLIVLLLVITLGLYTLFFTGKLGILADLVTGPQEEIVIAKTAQEMWDSAIVRSKSLRLVSADSVDSYERKLELLDDATDGHIYGKITPSKFQHIRRFLWDAEVPEGAELTLWVCYSSNCQDRSDSTQWQRVQGREESLNIGESVKEVEYMAYFNRNPLVYSATEAEKLLAEEGVEIDLPDYGVNQKNIAAGEEESEAVQPSKTQTKSGEKRLYAHYFFNNEDKGRYMGAIVDISGKHRDVFYLTYLTDRGAFVSEQVKGPGPVTNSEVINTERYQNVELVQDLQQRSAVKFVDEAEGNKEVGEAILRVRAGDRQTWYDIGGFISSMVSIAGEYSTAYNPIWVSDEQLFVGVEEIGQPLCIGCTSGINTDRYRQLDSFKYLQESIRMKFVPLEGAGVEVVDDGVGDKVMANLEVNDSDKGDFVGCGAEISGKYSDLFYPVWISDSQVKVGETEFKRWEFYRLCPDLYGNWRPCGNQTARENTDDFWALDTVRALQGVHPDQLKQEKVGIYVTVKETEEEPGVCDNFDRIEISPTEITLAPGGSYQFTYTSYNKGGEEVDISAQFSADGGAVDQSGNYLAPTEIGSYQVTVQSICGPEATAAVTIEEGAEPSPPLPTIGSPALYQIGLSAGVSIEEEEEPEGKPSGGVSPTSVPGWLKGGLLKTGADILVLVIVTILVVIAIIYLVSLLREGEDLGQQDKTEHKRESR